MAPLTPEQLAGIEGGLLERLFGPATSEIGKYLGAHLALSFSQNLGSVLEQSRALLLEKGNPDVRVPPRLGIIIIDQSSWAEDEVLQGMWAGLLVSSATPDGQDDSNLMFTDLLSRLSRVQARILEYGCANAKKALTDTGVLTASLEDVPFATLAKIAGTTDIHRLDRELDHLRTLGLLDARSGLPSDLLASRDYEQLRAGLTPSGLALQMYARCKGARDLLEFYDQAATLTWVKREKKDPQA